MQQQSREDIWLIQMRLLILPEQNKWCVIVVYIVSKKLANECEEIALNLELRNMSNLHSSFRVAVINKCPWTPSQEEL